MQKQADYIFGFHPIIEAMENGKTPDKILLQKGMRSEFYPRVMKLAKDTQTPVQFVPVQKLNSITRKNHQGIIAFMTAVEFFDLEQVLPEIFEAGEVPLLLVLDRVSDVRNFGAICRSAECAGVHAVVIPASGSARINADAVKTSSGALSRIKVCRSANLKKTLTYLTQSGLEVIGCHEKTEKLVYQADFTVPTAVVVGSEEDGISTEYLKLCSQQVKFPMAGSIGSLNVSVAAALVCFEAVRQRLNATE